MAKWTRFGPCAGTLLVAGTLALVWAPAADAALITIDVTSSESAVNVNDVFEVVITAAIEREILGFGFDMAMPGDLVELVSVDIAAPFTPMNTPDGDGLAGLIFPDMIAGADVQLATVSLRALAPGIAQIGIGVTPGDLTEGFAEADAFAELSVTPATVEILGDMLPLGGGGQDSPSPEPATLALLGLAGLVTLRRARKTA